MPLELGQPLATVLKYHRKRLAVVAAKHYYLKTKPVHAVVDENTKINLL